MKHMRDGFKDHPATSVNQSSGDCGFPSLIADTAMTWGDLDPELMTLGSLGLINANARMELLNVNEQLLKLNMWMCKNPKRKP